MATQLRTRRRIGPRATPLSRGLVYGSVGAVSLFMVFPFLWMAVSSLKPLSEIFTGTSFLPEHLTIDAYVRLFTKWDVGLSMWNSLYMATLATLLSTFLCALGGYAFAKFRFPGRGVLFGMLLGTMALPIVVIMVPLYVFLQGTFGWIDTPWPLIVPDAANAFGIFFMRQYMLSVPDDLLDAARVDGASEFRIFVRVVVPICMPGIVTLATISFIAHWNGFMWAKAVLHSNDLQTLPILLDRIQTSKPIGGVPYDLLMAGSVLSVIPMLILFLVFQRHLVEGLTSGAVRG